MYLLLVAYYFFLDDLEVLVCARALPATDLAALLYLLSLSIFEAVEATDLEVCLLLAIVSPPINWCKLV